MVQDLRCTSGLSGESFEERKRAFGENVISMTPETTFITLYIRVLQDEIL